MEHKPWNPATYDRRPEGYGLQLWYCGWWKTDGQRERRWEGGGKWRTKDTCQMKMRGSGCRRNPIRVLYYYLFILLSSTETFLSFHWHIRPSTQTSFPLFPLLALYFPSPPTFRMYPVEYDLWELNCWLIVSWLSVSLRITSSAPSSSHFASTYLLSFAILNDCHKPTQKEV